MANFDHPFLFHLNSILCNPFFTSFIWMPSIYLRILTINEAWDLGLTFQKLVILKVT